jgi:hypothetical protein
MVQALVTLDKDTNRVLNVVKAKYDLKDKGQAIQVLAKQYVETKEPELRPEYIAKMKKIMKQKPIHIGNIEDFDKRFGLNV